MRENDCCDRVLFFFITFMHVIETISANNFTTTPIYDMESQITDSLSEQIPSGISAFEPITYIETDMNIMNYSDSNLKKSYAHYQDNMKGLQNRSYLLHSNKSDEETSSAPRISINNFKAFFNKDRVIKLKMNTLKSSIQLNKRTLIFTPSSIQPKAMVPIYSNQNKNESYFSSHKNYGRRRMKPYHVVKNKIYHDFNSSSYMLLKNGSLIRTLPMKIHQNSSNISDSNTDGTIKSDVSTQSNRDKLHDLLKLSNGPTDTMIVDRYVRILLGSKHQINKGKNNDGTEETNGNYTKDLGIEKFKEDGRRETRNSILRISHNKKFENTSQNIHYDDKLADIPNRNQRRRVIEHNVDGKVNPDSKLETMRPYFEHNNMRTVQSYTTALNSQSGRNSMLIKPYSEHNKIRTVLSYITPLKDLLVEKAKLMNPHSEQNNMRNFISYTTPLNGLLVKKECEMCKNSEWKGMKTVSSYTNPLNKINQRVPFGESPVGFKLISIPNYNDKVDYPINLNKYEKEAIPNNLKLQNMFNLQKVPISVIRDESVKRNHLGSNVDGYWYKPVVHDIVKTPSAVVPGHHESNSNNHIIKEIKQLLRDNKIHSHKKKEDETKVYVKVVKVPAFHEPLVHKPSYVLHYGTPYSDNKKILTIIYLIVVVILAKKLLVALGVIKFFLALVPVLALISFLKQYFLYYLLTKGFKFYKKFSKLPILFALAPVIIPLFIVPIIIPFIYICKDKSDSSTTEVTYPTFTYPTVTYPTVNYPTVTYPTVTYPTVTYPTFSFPTFSSSTIPETTGRTISITMNLPTTMPSPTTMTDPEAMTSTITMTTMPVMTETVMMTEIMETEPMTMATEPMTMATEPMSMASQPMSMASQPMTIGQRFHYLKPLKRHKPMPTTPMNFASNRMGLTEIPAHEQSDTVKILYKLKNSQKKTNLSLHSPTVMEKLRKTYEKFRNPIKQINVTNLKKKIMDKRKTTKKSNCGIKAKTHGNGINKKLEGDRLSQKYTKYLDKRNATQKNEGAQHKKEVVKPQSKCAVKQHKLKQNLQHTKAIIRSRNSTKKNLPDVRRIEARKQVHMEDDFDEIQLIREKVSHERNNFGSFFRNIWSVLESDRCMERAGCHLAVNTKRVKDYNSLILRLLQSLFKSRKDRRIRSYIKAYNIGSQREGSHLLCRSLFPCLRRHAI